ncbi:IS21 family transposase ISAs29 [bioreactor metagenome]|uniref:IS21 family transposase ISAs29 n=1 Tax=bioreactor metagenome TaxID=1076179 RepID=A0A645ANP7_9ZZZZ
MNEVTLEKMGRLRLFGMQTSFRAILESKTSEQFTIDQMLATLVEAEWEEQENRKTDRLIKNAGFRYPASLEEIDYSHPRNLDRNQMLRLVDCNYLDRAENVLVTGATGLGKSYLISALGYQACLMGYKVLYHNTQKLFNALRINKVDGSYVKEIKRIEKQDLLILDDFGLQPLDNINSLALMEIIEDRFGKKSIIIGSQLPLEKWYDIITEKTVADAILDRLLSASHKITLKGDSLRRKKR